VLLPGAVSVFQDKHLQVLSVTGDHVLNSLLNYINQETNVASISLNHVETNAKATTFYRSIHQVRVEPDVKADILKLYAQGPQDAVLYLQERDRFEQNNTD
jgi:hypothetical protein